MLRSIVLRFASIVTMGFFMLLAAAPAAQAQITVGGHVGFVIPWVTHGGGQTTTIGDNFQIGFPLGVSFHGPGRMTLDLEMVPSISDDPRAVPSLSIQDWSGVSPMDGLQADGLPLT